MSSNHNAPKASVIMPVYNAGKYLDSAIESVLEQSFKDFELLLLNDGSIDGSLERMEHYARLDTRCKVHTWPNRGLVETLNSGVSLSRGDIIFRMDQDDICRPDRFERQIAYLKINPDCVVVGSRVMLIDPEGLPICPLNNEVSHKAIDAAHLSGKGGAVITHPSAAIRKSAIIEIGGYHSEFPHAEDIDLFLRLAERGGLANLPDILLDYRQHLGSIGYKHRETQKKSVKRAVEVTFKRRQLNEYSLPEIENKEIQAPSLADIHCKWGWWALSGKNLATARKHALKAIIKKPFDLGNLKLLACVFRGY